MAPTLTERKRAVNAASAVVTHQGIRYNHSVTRELAEQRGRFLSRRVLISSWAIAWMLLSMVSCSLLNREQQSANPEPISLTPTIWFSPSGTTAEIPYRNACHEAVAMPMADLLLGSVPNKLAKSFTNVTAQNQSEDLLTSDGVVEVGVGLRRIDLDVPSQRPGTYPATATVGLEMVFLARDGTMLFSRKLEGTGRGTVEVADQSCEVTGLDAIVQDAINAVAGGLAQQMAQSVQIREYAARRDTWVPLPARTGSHVIPPSQEVLEPTPAMGQVAMENPSISAAETVEPVQLSFRAIVRDENHDRLLEPDESLTLHIEVKNEGAVEAKDVMILVDGKAGLADVFPAEIVVGAIRPGESKRMSVTKQVTVPEEALPGELMLNLRTASPLVSVPPTKMFSLGTKPKRGEVALPPDVDQIPRALTGGKQSKAIIIAIGVGTFRDDQMPVVKHASHDAAVMAEYLHTIGSVPRERMRVLLDRQGIHQEFEETFGQWLHKRADAETVLYVYFSGRAVVDSSTGEVLLVPYDGTRLEPSRLYPLKRLQEVVSKLMVQRSIFMLDTSLDPSPGADLMTMPSPDWTSGIDEPRKDREMWMVGNRNLQEAHVYDQGRHGLFTYHLLRGLQGVADLDRDGTVMAGELCLYARAQAARVAREQFGNKQDPLCLPPVGRGAMIRIHPIAKGNNPKPTPTAKPTEETTPDSAGPPKSQVLVGP